MNVRHKVLIGAVGLLGLSGIGIGTAMASTTQTPTSPPVATTPSTVVDPSGTADSADGPQSGADTEKSDTAATEVNGDDHQDTPGANVDYTPPGETPEAAAAKS